jgi:hypothetical protein
MYPKELLVDLMEKIIVEDKKMGYMQDVPTETYIQTRRLEICREYHDHSGYGVSLADGWW